MAASQDSFFEKLIKLNYVHLLMCVDFLNAFPEKNILFLVKHIRLFTNRN